jgi:hypothetical protein
MLPEFVGSDDAEGVPLRPMIPIPRLLALSASVVALAYLGLLFSPPRVDGDTTFYLWQVADILHGVPIRDTHSPHGYPRLLAFLGLNQDAPWFGIVAVNLFFLAIGLCSTSFVLQKAFGLSRTESIAVCLLSCFSWLFIHAAPVAMSECVYFGISTLCLAMLYVRRFVGVAFVAACALAIYAWSVRAVGVALLPALAFFFAARFRIDRKALRVVFLVACVVAIIAGLSLRSRLTTPAYAKALDSTTTSPIYRVIQTAAWRIGEIGEFADNVSLAALEPTTTILPIDRTSLWTLANGEFGVLRYITGAAFAFLLAMSAWKRRSAFSPLECYLLVYAVILLLWPFESPRFLTPVIPFLLAYLCLAAKALRISKWAVRGYVTLFCLTGLIALGQAWSFVLFDREATRAAFHRDVTSWIDRIDEITGKESPHH